MVKLEAFDLSEAGRNVPYFRREMTILDKVLKQPGINLNKIMKEFSQEQIEGIYPALSQPMVESLVEELEVMGYVENRGGKVFPTPKAASKLAEFRSTLSAEEGTALQI